MPREALSTHRQKETGIVIEVWRAEDLQGPQSLLLSKPWITRCVEHSEVCSHESEELAVEAACDPAIVCRTCFWLEDLMRGRDRTL
jgi:hypothetical protein